MEKEKFPKKEKNEIRNIIKYHNEKYYVYALLRPTGHIFYIGKGIAERLFDHEKESENGNTIKNHVINKIKRENKTIYYHIFQFFHSEKNAYDFEIELIAKYGRMIDGGILSNITKGGDGWKGGHHSQETISKLSKKLRVTFSSPEYRERRSKIAKQLCQNKKHRDKIREGVLSYYNQHPQEAEKNKKKQKKAVQSNQMRQKMSQRMKKYYAETPGAIEKNSKALKKYYAETPGAIEKNSKAAKKAMNNPETKRKMSISTKKRFEKMPPGEWSKNQKEKLNNPETRKKMSISAKKRKMIEMTCKKCDRKYYKRTVNQFNKNICDTCKTLSKNNERKLLIPKEKF